MAVSRRPCRCPIANQTTPSSESSCQTEFGITPDKNGDTYCVTNVNPVVWLGTPDVQLMPRWCKGVSAKGRLAYAPVHQSAGFWYSAAREQRRPTGCPTCAVRHIMEHDVTVLKDFSVGEGKTLELRMGAFNVFNHPLVSFNNNNTTNLNLGIPGWTRWSGADAKHAPVPGFRRCEYQGGKQACGAGSEVYVLIGSCPGNRRAS